MTEFRNFGPGFDLMARSGNANISTVMTPEEFGPFDSVEKVFQWPFGGEFGNVGWIDRRPWAKRGKSHW